MGSILLSSAQLNSVWMIFVSPSGGPFQHRGGGLRGHLGLPQHGRWADAGRHHEVLSVWKSFALLGAEGRPEDPAPGLCVSRELPCFSLLGIWNPELSFLIFEPFLQHASLPSSQAVFPCTSPVLGSLLLLSRASAGDSRLAQFVGLPHGGRSAITGHLWLWALSYIPCSW